MSTKLHLAVQFALLVAFVVGVFAIINPPVANANHAGTVGFHERASLLGWAWSPTIGWISVNCDNSGQGCGSSDYKVRINTDKTMLGYAWSSNIGWIRFGGVSGPAGGGGKLDDVAQVTGSEGSWELGGWIRACSVFVNNCSGALHPTTVTGGWDGWISLSGDAKNGDTYAVSMNNEGEFRNSAAAWGDLVVGAVNFSDVFIDVSTDPSDPGDTTPEICSSAVRDQCVGDILTQYDLFCGDETIDCSDPLNGGFAGGTCDDSGATAVCTGPPSASSFAGTFSATPVWVREDNPVTFTWEVTGGAVECRAMGNDGVVYATGDDNEPAVTSLDITRNSTIFTIECNNLAGSTFVPVSSIPSVEVQLIPSVRES